MINSLGLDSRTIHAFPNDCILYRDWYEESVTCPKCQTPRYKEETCKVPRKVLRHFPLAPHIKHMLRSPKLDRLMTWVAEHKSKDGVMRVLSDSPAFEHIDLQWPDFVREPHNLKMGVALDGVNPFSMKPSKCSTWPVVVINYNLPPYLSIKKEHLMLSLLIPRK